MNVYVARATAIASKFLPILANKIKQVCKSAQCLISFLLLWVRPNYFCIPPDGYCRFIFFDSSRLVTSGAKRYCGKPIKFLIKPIMWLIKIWSRICSYIQLSKIKFILLQEKWFLRCGLMKRHDRSRFKSERTELIILKWKVCCLVCHFWQGTFFQARQVSFFKEALNEIYFYVSAFGW